MDGPQRQISIEECKRKIDGIVNYHNKNNTAPATNYKAATYAIAYEAVTGKKASENIALMNIPKEVWEYAKAARGKIKTYSSSATTKEKVKEFFKEQRESFEALKEELKAKREAQREKQKESFEKIKTQRKEEREELRKGREELRKKRERLER